MKLSLQTAFVILTCLSSIGSAFGQTNSTELTVNATAALLVQTNKPELFLQIHLINSSDHEIVVLTKNLNWNFETKHEKSWGCTVSYSNPLVTHEGHPVIPSLYELAPVTLQPNEEAFITRLVENDFNQITSLTGDTEILVNYAVSTNWGNRFRVWSGSATSKPFKAHVRKPR